MDIIPEAPQPIMKMFRVIVFLISHGLAMAGGVALGIYLLPILIAPDAPSDTEVANV